MKHLFRFACLFLFLLVSCSHGLDEINNNKPKEETVFSIEGTWYTNPEDNRYYIKFGSDGSFIWRYYQNIGSQTSNLNGFVTQTGKWYLDEKNKNAFYVQLERSTAVQYEIIEKDINSITVKKEYAGTGFGNQVVLYRNSKTFVYTVHSDIEKLMGTWYYDETKTGKYLKFDKDKYCYHHYFQGDPSKPESALNGWVTTRGIWNYNENTKILSITMNSEITYYYLITTLTDTMLELTMDTHNPAGHSYLYNPNPFYR